MRTQRNDLHESVKGRLGIAHRAADGLAELGDNVLYPAPRARELCQDPGKSGAAPQGCQPNLSPRAPGIAFQALSFCSSENTCRHSSLRPKR